MLVCTTIVESGLDIANANTLIVERGRRHGAVAAAPAARPGRPRPRARVRLLPLPAGEAAHRDGARPARDDRAAHRPRRRHARGDEGPRDPRRRQPARRRAVRAHRRRRLRPVRPAGRRGRRGVQGRRPDRGARPTSRSSCRSTRTCRTTTSRASGCAWRPTGGSPRRPTTPRSQAVREELARPLRPAADAGGEPARGGAVPGPRPPAGLTDVVLQGCLRTFRAGRAARVRRAAHATPLPEDARQARHPYHVGAAPHHGEGGRSAGARRRAAGVVPERSSTPCSTARPTSLRPPPRRVRDRPPSRQGRSRPGRTVRAAATGAVWSRS